MPGNRNRARRAGLPRALIVWVLLGLAAWGWVPFAVAAYLEREVPPRARKSVEGRGYYSSCPSARMAGVAPMRRGEPGYRAGLDSDGDGIACE